MTISSSLLTTLPFYIPIFLLISTYFLWVTLPGANFDQQQVGQEQDYSPRFAAAIYDLVDLGDSIPWTYQHDRSQSTYYLYNVGKYQGISYFNGSI